MIESGLAVIAACLPILHKLIAPSSIRSVFTSIRSALNLNALRSHSSTSSRPFKKASYSDIKREIGNSKPSYRETFETSEGLMDAYGIPDLESGPNAALTPAVPRQVHT